MLRGRTPFFLYLDEFQTFSTLHLATMASELRMYGVGLTLAHQHLSQLAPEDLLSLPNHHIYLRLMIDGEVSRPFSARTVGSNGEWVQR